VRIRSQHALVSNNNSAQIFVGSHNKIYRGVVAGLRDIKHLQGGNPSPQTQLRGDAFYLQAKMRGVKSALSR